METSFRRQRRCREWHRKTTMAMTMTSAIRKKEKTIKYFPRLFIFIIRECVLCSRGKWKTENNAKKPEPQRNGRRIYIRMRCAIEPPVCVSPKLADDTYGCCVCMKWNCHFAFGNEKRAERAEETRSKIAWCYFIFIVMGYLLSIQMVFNIVYSVFIKWQHHKHFVQRRWWRAKTTTASHRIDRVENKKINSALLRFYHSGAPFWFFADLSSEQPNELRAICIRQQNKVILFMNK